MIEMLNCEITEENAKECYKSIQQNLENHLDEIRNTLYSCAAKFGQDAKLRKEMAEEIIFFWGGLHKRSHGNFSKGNELINFANIVECLNNKDYDAMNKLIDAMPFGVNYDLDSSISNTVKFTSWFMTKEEQAKNKDNFILYIRRLYWYAEPMNIYEIYKSFVKMKGYKRFVFDNDRRGRIFIASENGQQKNN